MFIASVYSRSLDILPTYQSVGSQEDYLYSFGAKDYSVRAKDYLVICPRLLSHLPKASKLATNYNFFQAITDNPMNL